MKNEKAANAWSTLARKSGRSDVAIVRFEFVTRLKERRVDWLAKSGPFEKTLGQSIETCNIQEDQGLGYEMYTDAGRPADKQSYRLQLWSM